MITINGTEAAEATNSTSLVESHVELYRPLSDDHWLIILSDPDHSDWSPWSVRAPNADAAIKQAIADWHDWLESPDAADGDEDEPSLEDPDVIKVYLGSWIGERV